MTKDVGEVSSAVLGEEQKSSKWSFLKKLRLPHSDDKQVVNHTEQEFDPQRKLTETMMLPLMDGEYVHIETSMGQMRDAFIEFAENFGHDPEKARQFFEGKVEISFNKEGVNLDRLDNDSQQVYSKLSKMIVGDYMGVALRTKDGKYIVDFNFDKIATFLPNQSSRINIGPYKEGSLEARQMIAQKVVSAVTDHEMFHLLQFMEDPDVYAKVKAEAKATKIKGVVKALPGMAILPMFFIPSLHPIPSLAAAAYAGYAVYTLDDGLPSFERDADLAQHEMMHTPRKNNFYKFNYESDPKV